MRRSFLLGVLGLVYGLALIRTGAPTWLTTVGLVVGILVVYGHYIRVAWDAERERRSDDDDISN